MFEFFEHTADIGLRVRAEDLPGLFAEAGRGLAALLVENASDVRPTESQSIRIDGVDRTDLLLDFLNELLYEFNTHSLILTEFEIDLAEDGLLAQAKGERLDPLRHHLDFDIKAVTYHGLRVEPNDEGWLAEVILDI